jgi:hypothetical protein
MAKIKLPRGYPSATKGSTYARYDDDGSYIDTICMLGMSENEDRIVFVCSKPEGDVLYETHPVEWLLLSLSCGTLIDSGNVNRDLNKDLKNG